MDTERPLNGFDATLAVVESPGRTRPFVARSTWYSGSHVDGWWMSASRSRRAMTRPKLWITSRERMPP